MPFIELRSHTAFSFNDGALTPETLVKRAAELGFTYYRYNRHRRPGRGAEVRLESQRRESNRWSASSSTSTDDRRFLARTPKECETSRRS